MSDSILQQKKLVSPVRRLKPGENIKYLLLIKLPESDESFWEIITGREEAYNYIKNNISSIDVEESYIIASETTVDLDSLHTIYGFIKFVKEKNDIVDEFDIDDYLITNNNATDIGVGLESAGQVFTGIAGTFESDDD